MDFWETKALKFASSMGLLSRPLQTFVKCSRETLKIAAARVSVIGRFLIFVRAWILLSVITTLRINDFVGHGNKCFRLCISLLQLSDAQAKRQNE
ncbi:MAG TPA: hypothetical protein VN784_09205 [Candidatus Limnocylindrales bacterium]|nr:hypothetical protein [Candidatus Limnocylindrales bacterium]